MSAGLFLLSTSILCNLTLLARLLLFVKLLRAPVSCQHWRTIICRALKGEARTNINTAAGNWNSENIHTAAEYEGVRNEDNQNLTRLLLPTWAGCTKTLILFVFHVRPAAGQ